MPPPGFGPDRHPHPSHPIFHPKIHPQCANHTDGLSKHATHPYPNTTGVRSEFRTSASPSLNVTGFIPHPKTTASLSQHVTRTKSDIKTSASPRPSVMGIKPVSRTSASASQNVTRTRPASRTNSSPSLKATGINQGSRTSSSRGPNVTGLKPDVKNCTSASHNAMSKESRPAYPESSHGRARTEDDQTQSANTKEDRFRGEWNTHGGLTFPGR